jgi:hypothetical protein
VVGACVVPSAEPELVEPELDEEAPPEERVPAVDPALDEREPCAEAALCFEVAALAPCLAPSATTPAIAAVAVAAAAAMIRVSRRTRRVLTSRVWISLAFWCMTFSWLRLVLAEARPRTHDTGRA